MISLSISLCKYLPTSSDKPTLRSELFTPFVSNVLAIAALTLATLSTGISARLSTNPCKPVMVASMNALPICDVDVASKNALFCTLAIFTKSYALVLLASWKFCAPIAFITE